MEILAQLERLFAYDAWANREAVASLYAAEGPPPHALRIMAHIIAAQWLWLGRLRKDEQWIAVWPELTLAECEAQTARLPEQWRDYLGSLDADRLTQAVTYTNTKGESWSNTVQDIVMHVVIHSAYHRGQIATGVRAAGHVPAYTDFIHAARQGLVE